MKSSKTSQHIVSSEIRILNTKTVWSVKAGVSIFANLCLLPLRKNGLIAPSFPEKRAPTKVDIYLLPVCQILRNFTERNAIKITVSFACFAHVDIIKY